MLTNSLTEHNQKECLAILNNDYEVKESFPITSVRPLEASNCSEYVVAHVTTTPGPKKPLQAARNFSEVVFLPYILETMRQMGFNRLLRLQSYTWPHLNQGSGHGAIIVSAPRSGRSLCYIPPMCQTVGEELKIKRHARKISMQQNCINYQGAVALVIVPDLKRAQQIAYLCNRFLRKAKNEEWLTLTLTVPSNPKSSDFYHRLLNGSGCLVATLSQFNWLCDQDNGLMQFPNLRFVVYDDIDLMEKSYFEKAHYYIKSLVKSLEISPQLVIVSQTYKKYFLTKLFTDFSCDKPLVIFGDLLEAALYGGTAMRLILGNQESKLQQVLKVLEQRPPHIYRTLIYCKDDMEINKLLQTLWKEHKYECLTYYQDDGLAKQMEMQDWILDSRGFIFLTTDHCPEADIRNAETLIHYSMSTSWSKFKMRHLSLSNWIRNQLIQEKVSEAKTLLSLTLLDDQSDRQLPRLVDFLEMHQQVDQNMKQIVRNIRDELNLAKANEPGLCPLLLTHGECRDTMCEERHQLYETDHLPSNSPSLIEGVNIKVQLVKIYSPAHLCVRLLEYLPIQGSWQVLPRNSTLDLRLQLLQADERKSQRYWPPQSRDICIYLTRQSNTFERVRVLRVPKIPQINIYRSDLQVEVQALDVDTRRFFARTGQLYVCPEDLKNQPPMAVDLRLLGVVPSSGERTWHPDDDAIVRQIRSWLTTGSTNEVRFLQADIKFAMSHTIFINDLVVMIYAPTFKKHVVHLRLVQTLQKYEIERYDRAKSKILEFFKDYIRDAADRQKEKLNKSEKQQEEIAIKSENYCNNILTSRTQRMLNLAREMAKRKEELQEPSKEIDEALPALTNVNSSVNGIEELLKCMMKCVIDEHNAEHDGELSEQILNKDTTNSSSNESNKSNSLCYSSSTPRVSNSTIKRQSVQTSIQLPSNIIQPEVTYYQTLKTLELQVILPDENMLYNAYLSNLSVIIFKAPTTSSTIYQFAINTNCPYQGLIHHMKGRCVYLKIYKTLARIYPLDFSHYIFMKPNYDRFQFIDNYRKQIAQHIEYYIIKMGYINNWKRKKLHNDDKSDGMDSEKELDDHLTEKANYEFECD